MNHGPVYGFRTFYDNDEQEGNMILNMENLFLHKPRDAIHDTF